MLDTVPKLNRDGDYLVLFQTIRTRQLKSPGPVPTSVPPDAPNVSESGGLETEIRNGLTGRKVSCGSFVGVWAPHE
jgi:hypothetical protein